MDKIEIEDHVIAHQAGLIRAKYGEEQADKCNYGWAIDDDEKYLKVSTKIYRVPTVVLTTTVYDDKLEYYDQWEPY